VPVTNRCVGAKILATDDRPKRVTGLFEYQAADRTADNPLGLQAKDLPGTPATAPQSFYLDSEWWAKNGKGVEKRFQEWLLTAK
jgi:outer membrane receptor for ferric coprogen and ferric-rhodotorulic acid